MKLYICSIICVSKYCFQKCKLGEGYVRLDESQKSVHSSLMDMEPPTFLSNFNNPCWIECLPKDPNQLYPNHTRFWLNPHYSVPLTLLRENIVASGRSWRLRCLPKFYLIGMAKCGTTDLFQR